VIITLNDDLGARPRRPAIGQADALSRRRVMART
jgi:hypothetical protein